MKFSFNFLATSLLVSAAAVVVPNGVTFPEGYKQKIGSNKKPHIGNFLDLPHRFLSDSMKIAMTKLSAELSIYVAVVLFCPIIISSTIVCATFSEKLRFLFSTQLSFFSVVHRDPCSVRDVVEDQRRCNIFSSTKISFSSTKPSTMTTLQLVWGSDLMPHV